MTQPTSWKPLFCIKIHCIPVGQPRARATVRKLKNGKVRAGMYDPKTIKQKNGKKKPHPIVDFKRRVRDGVMRHHKGPPVVGPVKVHVEAVFPRPTSKVWKTRAMPREFHTSRNDVDNVTKGIFDAVNEILFVDDSQICILHAEKWIAAGDEAPHVVLAVWTYEGEPKS